MIDCIFTVDYEIYGNGQGSLRELVLEPTEKLQAVFKKWQTPWVAFIEAAEMEIIGSAQPDPAIGAVERQICELHADGVEIGLHIHPQWYKARYENGTWRLEHSEYNLCRLAPSRLDEIISRSISYLRRALMDISYVPLSFRAGNWLLQPTAIVAQYLFDHGIRVDSSVFKGGFQHQHGLDYRASRKNGYYWRFSEDVNIPDPRGNLLECPTYTRMVPPWKMFTSKRVGLQQKGPATAGQRLGRLPRLRDLARLRHPMKLDFCRQTADQMAGMLDVELKKDNKAPSVYRPLVAIGHTKDLVEADTLDRFLSILHEKSIPIITMTKAFEKIVGHTR